MVTCLLQKCFTVCSPAPLLWAFCFHPFAF
jgi:hypothetical protein